MDTITYVGLDVHKATVSVAVAESGRRGEFRQVGVFANRPEVLAGLAARLSKGGGRLSFCYEAGPRCYGLHRRPRPHQIAHRFVRGIWDPDRCQRGEARPASVHHGDPS